MGKDARTAAILIAAQHSIITRLAETVDLAHGAIDLVLSDSFGEQEGDEAAIDAVHAVLVQVPPMIEGIMSEASRLIDELDDDAGDDEGYGLYL